jgi:hypothetical protein
MFFSRRHLGRAALAALLLTAAAPAATQARTFQVDGRVTGPPLAKGGAVTVPLQLSTRSGRALRLGTRRVRVRFRRARLPVSGAAGRARVAPRALRAGDRLKGVTSLSRKTRRRLRYRARPTLQLRRPRLIRPLRRRRAAPPPRALAPPARTPEQIVRDVGARATSLSIRIGTLGSITRQFATLSLPVGLAGVTFAFESLKAELAERAATDPAFDELLAEVEALVPAAEWLGTAMGAIDTSIGATRALGAIGDAVETLAVQTAVLGAQAGLLQQIPGVMAQVTAIEEALIRIDGRLAAIEPALGSFSSRTGEVNDGMGSLADAASALATDAREGADPASTSAGVDQLAGDAAAVGSGFGALRTSMDALGPGLDALQADAVALEAMVEALEALGLGGG